MLEQGFESESVLVNGAVVNVRAIKIVRAKVRVIVNVRA